MPTEEKPAPPDGRHSEAHRPRAKPKRFYATAQAHKVGDGWEIRLDGRPLRTPARRAMLIPNAAFAEAVAEEWNAQEETIDKSRMPLTGLACVALDVAAIQPDALRAELREYAQTDQLCYREPDRPPLRARQDALYDPLLAWAAGQWGVQLLVTDGIRPIAQPPESLARLAAAVESLDAWQLAALSIASGLLRSLIAGLAMVTGRLDARQAQTFASLEETVQAERWGMDPAQVERLDAWRRDFEAVERWRRACAASA